MVHLVLLTRFLEDFISFLISDMLYNILDLLTRSTNKLVHFPPSGGRKLFTPSVLRNVFELVGSGFVLHVCQDPYDPDVMLLGLFLWWHVFVCFFIFLAIFYLFALLPRSVFTLTCLLIFFK